MAKVNAPLLSFNRGVVSPRALARVDVEKLRLSAEEQTNWLPTVLGPMTLRPGLEYVGTTRGSAEMWPIRFVFSNSDTAILELTTERMRVRLGDDESLVAFDSVSTTVTNGSFSSSTGWTLTSSGASTAAISGGLLSLSGSTASGTAKCTRSVSVAGGDTGVEHCLYIDVDRGPVTFRAGSTSGGDEYITSTVLETGVHYLSLTPTGTFYVQFEGKDIPARYVNQISVFTGTLELTTPWTTDDLPYVRYDQSADVIIVTCYGLATKRIERRSETSWSLVDYKTSDGPFLVTTDDTISITPSALTGDVTLTASRALFRSGHVGALWRIFSPGQIVLTSLSDVATKSESIRVAGVGASRDFTYSITGTFVGAIELQRSLDGPDSGFATLSAFSAPTSATLNDTLDNSIAWYRWFMSGYGSGTAVVGLNHSGGGAAGICRITGFSSATSVTAEVLDSFSSLSAATDWREGAWSDYRGHPTAVRLHEGRLFFASGDHVWGSVSDAYTSFDYDATGDSAPIDRTIGYGPVDTINWLLSLNRLVIGREGSEITARSSSFDEPLTPTNFNLKDASTLGSARLPAVKVDTRGIFVQQGYRRVYDLSFSGQTADYSARELTRLSPDICSDDVVAIAVQRQPDTRVHFVLDDGTVAVLVYDLDDEVVAWWKIETDGEVENVVVLPGAPEDKVYYVVKRTINSNVVRYLERHARFDQCSGLPDSRLADAHLIYSGAATTTITGLSHLEGESVVVWGYTSGATTGKDLGTYTVASGQITGLSASVVWACVGLGYDAFFKSAKLAYGAQMGTALSQHKRTVKLGLILHNTHYQGIEYGPDADNLDPLPLVEEGTETPSHTVWEEFDKPMISIPGVWDTDSRLCLQASAPRPATVLGAVVQVKTNED